MLVILSSFFRAALSLAVSHDTCDRESGREHQREDGPVLLAMPGTTGRNGSGEVDRLADVVIRIMAQRDKAPDPGSRPADKAQLRCHHCASEPQPFLR